MARKTAKAVAVDPLRHKDKRGNIATEELRDFVTGDEAQPKTILYPQAPRSTRSSCGMVIADLDVPYRT